MRRRDFTIGLLLASAVQSAQAKQPAKQGRIAIVISTGPAASINDKGLRLWHLQSIQDVSGIGSLRK
jgi:hypothetical protein